MNTPRVGLIAMSASIVAIGVGAIGADCDGVGGGIAGDTQTSSSEFEAVISSSGYSTSSSHSGVGVNSASGVGGSDVTSGNGVTASTGAPDGSSGGFGEDMITPGSVSTGTAGMANSGRRESDDAPAALASNAANQVNDISNRASAATDGARSAANRAVQSNNVGEAANDQAGVARSAVETARDNAASSTLADSSAANAVAVRQSVLPQAQRAIADSSGLVTGLALGAAYSQQAQLANAMGQSVVILQTCEGTPADEIIKADIIGNFQPASTQVSVGDVVRFEPAGLTGIRSLYGDYQTATGEVTCLTFNRPGTYRFDGSSNELAKGTITVFAN